MRLVTQDGHAYPLRPGDNSIGRSEENSIVLSGRSMSRRHAVIRLDAGASGDNCGIYVIDTGSVNGTYIDGRRLRPGEWAPLQPGASLQFGDDTLCRLAQAAPVSPQRPVDYEGIALQSGSQAGRSPQVQGRPGGLDLLVRAVGVSLSRTKMTVAAGGTLAVGLALVLTSFLAARLFIESPVLAILFVVFGAVLAWLVLSLTLGALTCMCHAELTGRQPVGIREAIRYAGVRWPQFALTPLALLLVISAIALAEVAVLLLGRVEYLGELLTSLLFLPAFALNVFLLAAAAVGSWLLLPILVDRGRGIAASLTYLFRLIRAVPGRVALYLGAASAVMWLATAALWGLVIAALVLTIQALTAGLGAAKLSALLASDFSGIVGLIPGLDMLPTFGRYFGGNPATYAVAGRLLQLGLLVTLACAVAFPLVIQASLACAVYLNVKDDVTG